MSEGSLEGSEVSEWSELSEGSIDGSKVSEGSVEGYNVSGP